MRRRKLREDAIKIYKIRKVVNAELLLTKFHRTITRGQSLKLLGDMIKLGKRPYFFSVGSKFVESVATAGCRVNTTSRFKAELEVGR